VEEEGSEGGGLISSRLRLVKLSTFDCFTARVLASTETCNDAPYSLEYAKCMAAHLYPLIEQDEAVYHDAVHFRSDIALRLRDYVPTRASSLLSLWREALLCRETRPI
jgi:hypothetical protein